MGGDARLFIFDHELYRGRMVPAFLRLLRDGSMDDWLLEPYRRHTAELGLENCIPTQSTVFGSIDVLKYCTYLDDELAVREITEGPQSLYDCDWETRACRHGNCPARGHCPFHFAGGHSAAAVDGLLRLFQLAVVDRCLGTGQFLGRSIDSFFYWDTLDNLGVPAADPIRTLLERLGRRGFVVGYEWVAGTDGIHGWLQPEEAKALAERLFALDLPLYECSFVGMEKFKSIRNILEGRVTGLDFQWPSYEHPDTSFGQLSLSYVRTVRTLAVREGRGVLWGNDIA